jgi:hypothetical protein
MPRRDKPKRTDWRGCLVGCLLAAAAICLLFIAAFVRAWWRGHVAH